MKRVAIQLATGYSGRGGFPSGPYYGADLVDEDGAVIASTKRVHLETASAVKAATRLARRRGWELRS